MWKYKLLGLYFFIDAVIGKLDFEASRLDVAQSRSFYKISKVGQIDLPEISGLKIVNDTFYCITDSGGKPWIYMLDKQLNPLDTLKVESANKDWEALTSKNGSFLIGDFGNNLNIRRDLKIIQYSSAGEVAVTRISYSQQDEFPPPKSAMNFDAEAMFYADGKLHVFSKNRGKKCVKHYAIPDIADPTATITPIEELWLSTPITGADSFGNIVVLSGYGKLYFFRLEKNKIFENPIMLIESTRFGQNEAVAFLDENTLIVCNEKGKFFKVDFTLPETD